MSTPLSNCCDRPPIADESDLCAGCYEHADYYYPSDTHWTSNYGYCDHCGKQGYVHQEIEVFYDEHGKEESQEPITSLCAQCGDK